LVTNSVRTHVPTPTESPGHPERRLHYNDIATAFATRLECVPDRWVAALGGMKPAALLGAENFERAAVPVKFV